MSSPIGRSVPTPENGHRFVKDWNALHPDGETLDHFFAVYLFEIPILNSWNDPEHWFSKTPSGESLDAFYQREISISVKDQESITGELGGERR